MHWTCSVDLLVKLRRQRIKCAFASPVVTLGIFSYVCCGSYATHMSTVASSSRSCLDDHFFFCITSWIFVNILFDYHFLSGAWVGHVAVRKGLKLPSKYFLRVGARQMPQDFSYLFCCAIGWPLQWWAPVVVLLINIIIIICNEALPIPATESNKDLASKVPPMIRYWKELVRTINLMDTKFATLLRRIRWKNKNWFYL